MIRTNSKEFKSVIKGKNLMTPDVLGYYISGNYIVELSQGTGFSGEQIYGVTVINGETMQREFDLDKCFDNKTNAIKHIEGL